MTAPLLVTADPALRDDLLRLSAAAGVTPDVVPDRLAALRAWGGAPVVLVGVDVAASLAEAAPPRRDEVHVVAHAGVPHEVFRTAVALGASSVAELPVSEQWVVDLLGDSADGPGGAGRVIGVVGGSGGAGATTLACALGQMAARRGEAIVIDGDPLGPGLDRILGVDGHDGTRWDGLCHTTGRLSARALREAVPRKGSLGVLTWRAGVSESLQAFAMREAVSAARRGHDTVVIDLPRTTDAIVEEVAARCDLLLLVVLPTLSGVASASRWCVRRGDAAPPHLVLRGTGMPEGAVAAACRAPVLRTIPEQRSVVESVSVGLGPVRSPRGGLGRAAAEILRHAAGVAA